MRHIKTYFKKIFYFICESSLKIAAREQGLNGLSNRLEKIVPDIVDQFSMFKTDTTYLKTKTRNMHAFQISLVNRIIKEFQKLTIVDIGDSAGTHLQYILGLHSQNKDIETLSVNLDCMAVKKIEAKGLKVINARAENLKDYNIDADIFLSFETLEHIMNPFHFLHQLSLKTNAKYLIITMPYIRNSRVGLHHIRRKRQDCVNAENTHIFEFNPEDWKLIVKHSGWNIVEEKIYLQYPKRNILRITKPLWKRFDFEGFYGLILKRDHTYSSRYKDW